MPRMLSSRIKRLVLPLACCLLTLAAILTPTSQANQLQSITPGTQTIQLPADTKPTGMNVNVGILAKNIYAVDLAGESFLADGWYWASWGEDVQKALQRHNIDPSEIIELSNEIERGPFSATEVITDEAKLEAGDKYSISFRFSSKFNIDDVTQRLAPFDNQKLGISLEVKPIALSEGPDKITLVPLPIEKHPIAGESSSVNGFLLTNASWSRQITRYTKAIKATDANAQTYDEFSRVTAVFTYTPNFVAVFLKWLLPIAVVMGIVIMAPSIDGALGDVRLAIPSAALLTLVILQDNYKAHFPPAPYLTYLDELYTYSYLVCFAIFILFLAGTNAISRASEANRKCVTERVNRIDIVVQGIATGGFLMVAIVGWFA